MICFGERCYSNQYDKISYDEISDDEISGDEISASRFMHECILGPQKKFKERTFLTLFLGKT